MARIFSALALLAVLLMAANFAIGLWVGDFNAAARDKRSAQARMIELDRVNKLARKKSSPEYEEARREYGAADERFRIPRGRMTIHLLLGSGAALAAILVSSVTITYFIGTSRWCKEVCETYRLPVELSERSAALKRSAFPWALAGVVLVIGVVALGAAADPSGANFNRSSLYVMPHYVASMLMLVAISVSFWVQFQRITANHAVIEEILAQVKRIRGKVSSES